MTSFRGAVKQFSSQNKIIPARRGTEKCPVSLVLREVIHGFFTVPQFQSGPDDFKRRSIDGLGGDWPIAYEAISSWYDRVERLIGVFGSKEGIRNEPDGEFLSSPRPCCYELLIQNAYRRLGIPAIPSDCPYRGVAPVMSAAVLDELGVAIRTSCRRL